MNCRKIAFILFLTYCLANYGCGEGTYVAEKKYWRVSRDLNKFIEDYKNTNMLDEAQIGKIIFAFKEITLRYPDWEGTLKVRFDLAQLYKLKGTPELAIKEYQTICKDFSGYKEYCANAQRRIASIYEEQNDWPQAEKIYRQIINENPYTLTGLLIPLYLAQQYAQRKSPEETTQANIKAIEFYKQAIYDSVETLAAVSSLDFMVVCFLNLNQAADAVEALAELKDKYPNSVIELRALYKIAQLYRDNLSSPNEAVNHYRQLLEKYPNEHLAQKAREELEGLTQ